MRAVGGPGGPFPPERLEESEHAGGSQHARDRILEALDLRGGYRDEAFRDVQLAVAEGQVVALVGPNGAGKSALLLTLAGQLRPLSGEVRLAGRPMAQLPARERARRLALLWQRDEAPGDFRVAEFVALGRSPHAGAGALPDGRAVAEALDRCDASHLAGRRLGALSGGERQRVRLAQAIAQVAGVPGGVLLLDEPTTALDLRGQAAFLALVRQVARHDGLGVVAILHDLNLAASACDRVALLGAGRLVAVGGPAEVLTADRVALAFGTAVEVVGHPRTGTPILLPRWDATAEPGTDLDGPIR